ncbi:ubiquinol-cytochrome C chaperone family protein [Chelatococcus sp. GCM10030263]|uniref:ubiquinol-cytochrome C chaperone family protein n=1 Tax=Chelatococcus sp. GCM10030263 TaxID=3273387 RepID=UPI00360E1FC2
MIFKLFSSRPGDDAAGSLYTRVNAAARAPALYGAGLIPDTVQGRFESLALHTVVVLRRLRALPAPAPDLAQDFIDRLFLEIERALREIGISDLAVPKRMKDYAKGFYGRAKSYDEALAAGDDAALLAAIARNVGAGDPGAPERLATYIKEADNRMSGLDLATILSSPDLFPEAEALVGGGGRAIGTSPGDDP